MDVCDASGVCLDAGANLSAMVASVNLHSRLDEEGGEREVRSWRVVT